MAKDWRTACWKAEREVEEYKGTIVPALVERVKELERETRRLLCMNEEQSLMLGKMYSEVVFTRKFIHEQGLEFALLSAQEKEKEVTG